LEEQRLRGSRIKMPKRPSDEHGGGRSAKLSTLRRRRHLYLVLDDWELGYSIRKIDLPPDSGSDDLEQSTDDDCTTEQCLPPAVFRLEAPHACSGLFAAFGSKIMFMAVHDTPWGTIPMYDVHPDAGSHRRSPARVGAKPIWLCLCASGQQAFPPRRLSL
jgi:hypothetical protein